MAPSHDDGGPLPAVFSPCRAEDPLSDRPNFLFFCTDQQRADYLGCYGHPVLRTPNIDGIAARGTRFDNFHVATPICMPNRATMLTGRMPSLHGVRHNGIELSAYSNTFVTLLADAGYRTALLGKSHHQTYGKMKALLSRAAPRPGYHEPSPGLREARCLPENPDHPFGQEDAAHWPRGEDFLSLPYYGYQHARLCTGHADRVGGHYAHWLAARHPDPESLRGPQNALPHDLSCPQAWRTAMPEELYPTTYVAEMAEEYLQGHADAGTTDPFFAFVSFPDPHHPFTPPGKYWDMYDPDDMALPRSFAGADSYAPPHVAWAIAARKAGRANTTSPALFAVNEREAREAMALTCGMITMIDDAVGRILDRLRATGLDKNTVIVFTSDHGDFLGDHQLMLKGPIHYRSLIRVPFIWSDPGDATGRTESRLGGTIDIARTVLERARVEPYGGMQGHDLLADDDGPDALLIEEDGQATYLGLPGPARVRTVVTSRHRATIYHGVAWGEIYDLEEDPDELNNLWDSPEHMSLRCTLIERLARLEMAAADRSPLPVSRG